MSEEPKVDGNYKLLDILGFQSTYELFVEYLEGEFSVENALFWKEIEGIK